MIDREEICEKIVALYPDLGKCGIDVNVGFDEDQNVGGQKSEIRRQITETTNKQALTSQFFHF